MSQSTCELRPEAEPRVTNMYFEAFFFTSRVVYTIFHHALDGKRYAGGNLHFRSRCDEKTIRSYRK